MPPDPKRCAWYVESPNDLFVFVHLMEHYGVSLGFDLEQKGGVDRVLETLEAQLVRKNAFQFERIGIVVDADEDIGKRWRRVRAILERSGYTSVPEHPDPHGTIITEPDRPTVGVWIMPDNRLPGELEHVIAFLIPGNQENTLWQYARMIVEQLPERRFAEQDTIKANMHSWLAWQARPGTPMGLAVAQKFLDPGVPEAGRFVQWVQRLFLEEPTPRQPTG